MESQSRNLQDTPAGHKILIDVIHRQVTISSNMVIPSVMPKKTAMSGQWVNENNLKTNLSGTLTYNIIPVNEKLDIPAGNRTFNGYRTQER